MEFLEKWNKKIWTFSYRLQPSSPHSHLLSLPSRAISLCSAVVQQLNWLLRHVAAVDDDNKADNKLATALGDVYFVSCVIKPRKHSHVFPPHPKKKSRIWVKKQHRRVVSRRRRVDTQKEGWTPLHARFDYSKIINLSYILSLDVARRRVFNQLTPISGQANDSSSSIWQRERKTSWPTTTYLVQPQVKWYDHAMDDLVRQATYDSGQPATAERPTEESDLLRQIDVVLRVDNTETNNRWRQASLDSRECHETENYMYKNISPFTLKHDKKKSLPSGFE